MSGVHTTGCHDPRDDLVDVDHATRVDRAPDAIHVDRVLDATHVDRVLDARCALRVPIDRL